MAKNVIPRARELTAHRVNGLNEALRAFVLDAPGEGGACHEYLILVPVGAHDEACYEHNGPPEDPNREYYRLTEKPSGPDTIEGTSLCVSELNQVAWVERFDTENPGDPVSSRDYFTFTRILFQNGPIREQGINGISQEILIAVLIDRLEGFQTGDYKCHDNQVALDHLQGARLWAHKRTMDRMARNVEGTRQA